MAALTGLPAATPVAAGALDVCSAALGCGAVNEGDIYTILGTTCCTGIVCRGPQTVNEATRFVTHTEAGQVISLFPMQAGMPNIDWLQQHISLDADLGRLEQAIAAVEPRQRRRLLAAVPQWRTCAVLQPGRAGRLFRH